MKNIIYISDFFANEILGGAELSDKVLIDYLIQEGYNVKTVKSETFNPTIHSILLNKSLSRSIIKAY